MDGVNHRTADTGIFSLGREFEKSILNQLLAALAGFGCVSSLVSQRSSVRHNRTDRYRPNRRARVAGSGRLQYDLGDQGEPDWLFRRQKRQNLPGFS